MNGVHDMGGMQCFGKVEPEQDEPVFHAPWEGRVLAMHRAMGYVGLWNIDINRLTRERMPPDLYLGSSYYKKWAISLEDLCVKYGLLDRDELTAGHARDQQAKAVTRRLTASDADKVLSRRSFERAAPQPARFKPGERVRTRNLHPSGHTRLPRYARGRSGVIECIRGCHVFPDSLTSGKGEDPHWLYTVVFDARELWGESADPTSKVSIDAWEPYLEAISFQP
jgi:nitrile hydratase subunit beta